MKIRFARKDDLDQVNVLRKQVNDLHVEGKPDVFKPGFSDELRNYIHVIFNDPEQKIVVVEDNGEICGFAVLHHIFKPENPFMYVRDFLDIDEFAVDEKHRRQGIASALTSRLAREILRRGKVPFYCSAWSNIPSVRNAVKSGFIPSWVEMSVKPTDIVDEMNGDGER